MQSHFEGTDPFYKPLLKEKDFLSDFTTPEDYKKNIKQVIELADKINDYEEIITFLAASGDSQSQSQINNIPPSLMPDFDPDDEDSIDRWIKSIEEKLEETALEEAKNGSKHAKTYRDYKSKNPRELKKAIGSLREQIRKHKEKILDRKKIFEDFENLNPKQKEALIYNGWPKEIIKFMELIKIFEGILKELI